MTTPYTSGDISRPFHPLYEKRDGAVSTPLEAANVPDPRTENTDLYPSVGTKEDQTFQQLQDRLTELSILDQPHGRAGSTDGGGDPGISSTGGLPPTTWVSSGAPVPLVAPVAVSRPPQNVPQNAPPNVPHPSHVSAHASTNVFTNPTVTPRVSVSLPVSSHAHVYSHKATEHLEGQSSREGGIGS